MYPPPYYQTQDFQKIVEVIYSFPFATVITIGNQKPYITHIPLIYNKSRNTLVGHIDKNNPQVATLINDALVTAIFHGPDAYISPSKMATKQLPTWNYIKVHAQGAIQEIKEPNKMMETMIEMTRFLEGEAQNYILSSSNKTMHKLVQYIHCFEITNIAWEGKFKESQDKNDKDQKMAKEVLIKSSQAKIKKYFGY